MVSGFGTYIYIQTVFVVYFLAPFVETRRLTFISVAVVFKWEGVTTRHRVVALTRRSHNFAPS